MRALNTRHFTVALVYLGLALWCMRVVLPDVTRLLPYPAVLEGQGFLAFERADQQFVAAQVYRNARRLLSAPGRVLDNGFCYPVPHALTLGEHMLAESVLGIVPAYVTGNPITTLNVVTILTRWLAALSMYAFVLYWTRSVAAGFVAGCLFGFQWERVFDVSHPFVHGNLWTPLALLFTHRLFTQRRWRDVAGLVLFLGLQLLESIYPVVGLAMLGAVYGGWQLVRHRRALLVLAPKLAVLGVSIGALAVSLYAPYLHTRAVWHLGVEGHFVFLRYPFDLGFGNGGYMGSVALALGALGIWDRMRRRRPQAGEDPRWALLVAGVLVLWLAVAYVRIPFTTVLIPSLWYFLHEAVPGLDVGRAFATVTLDAQLILQVLAGYGVLWLIDGRRALTRRVLTLALAAASCLEVLWPPLAVLTYGRAVEFLTYSAAPPDDLRALYRTIEPGAVFDVPFNQGPLTNAESLLLSAYHGQPVNGCCSSYQVSATAELREMATRVPQTPALDALYALGFRTLAVHTENYLPAFLPVLQRVLDEATVRDRRLTLVGTAGEHLLYRIASPVRFASQSRVLGAPRRHPEVATASPPRTEVEFFLFNASYFGFRHPDPIQPMELRVRWSRAGEIAAESRVYALLPLALGPLTEMPRRIDLPIPVGLGEYTVSLETLSDPPVVLAQRVVRVEVPGPPAP